MHCVLSFVLVSAMLVLVAGLLVLVGFAAFLLYQDFHEYRKKNREGNHEYINENRRDRR